MALTTCIQRSVFFKSKTHFLASVYSYSTGSLREIPDTKLETAARGTGYRSSFNGITCTVFGASGCIGTAIVNRLANKGTQVVIPYRGDPYFVFESKVAGDLGQTLFTPFHLEDEDSLRRAMKYSDTVVNCIGREYNTLNFTIERCNVEGARRIARIAREMGIKRLIHFSSMGVTPTPREIMVKGGSRFIKSKWASELAVREEFPDAIIVRPSTAVGGEIDRFFTHYGCGRSYVWGYYHLWKMGKETVKQPVYIPDIAAGVFELVTRHVEDVKGKTYQFVGPRRYELYDLVRYMMDLMWKDENFSYYLVDSTDNIYFPIYRAIVDKLYINFPKPGVTMYKERFDIEHTTDDVDPNLPTLRDLGVKPLNIEAYAPQFLFCWRQESTYPSDPGESEVRLPRVLDEVK